MLTPRRRAAWIPALVFTIWAAWMATNAPARGAAEYRDSGCFGRIPPADSIATYRDGPHVFWEDDQHARVVYLVHDAQRGTDELVEQTLTVERPGAHGLGHRTVELRGFAGDTRTFAIGGQDVLAEAIQARPESICVVGDLHGEYEDAVGLLRGCGIIDEHDDWAFGRGHVVFCGDVLDRGDGATDCLWLVRKLEHQAALSGGRGGRVHYLLGNHERLVLNNDLRYVACAPLYLCDALGIEYADLFGPRTELGSWLRTLPTAIRLGDLLCVHGGISPEVVKTGLTLDAINATVLRCLEDSACPGDETAKLLAGAQGPLWYRGYFGDAKQYKRITADELQEVLARFGATRVVVGHSRHDWIEPIYDGRVIPTNVAFAEPDLRDQCLLITGDDYYRAYSDGTRDWIISTKGVLRDRLAAAFDSLITLIDGHAVPPDSQHVAFVLYDPQHDRHVRFNPERCARRYSPCSTFKIPNTLIGLETGVITGADFRMAWDAQRDPRGSMWPESWAADQDLASAMRNSVVWFYQEIARRIGADAYPRYLARFDYGNQDISGGVDRFWLATSLAISADEQVRFLERFFRGELGVSATATDIVKSIIVLEEGEGYRLSGKTGGGPLPDGRFLGWLVGYVERGPEVFFYALNVDGPTFPDIAGRPRALVRAALVELGLLPGGQH
jgi:beta-lactamase class D